MIGIVLANFDYWNVGELKELKSHSLPERGQALLEAENILLHPLTRQV